MIEKEGDTNLYFRHADGTVTNVNDPKYIRRLEARITELEAAIAWYADYKNYNRNTLETGDITDRARKALGK